ncbi:SURF1 family protein [Acuticoccus sp. M5D2P5]|uniref:SURF1 family protein n=1 Tax=Acuticoccus kalidii TaxID=2910977 RepID=UPI001F1D5596|nr:SURF1 family protein [Acuticoccus kalidii]MCF3936608.1 SURF1 family protein [Acuticoccus kalidii]
MARTRRRLVAILLLTAFGAVLFSGLGVWQVERRAWKLDLIAHVSARLAADPVAAPGPADWPRVEAAEDAYRKVRVSGVFGPEETFVQAVTELGGGFWVMAPFVTDEGFTILVNRGFISPDLRDPVTRPLPEGHRTVTGLMRMSEPGGGFLRANVPAENRWYSRDVEAIAAAANIGAVAPYFIDASEPTGAGPVAGLTVVTFRNSHLVYAITWFALAAMCIGAAIIAIRHERGRSPAKGTAGRRERPQRGLPSLG